jgi:hypothetical protein
VSLGVQFSLNRRHRVGRLDLLPHVLENYVDAFISDWAGMDSDDQLDGVSGRGLDR